MLPEIFCSAKDCDCKPPTAVLSASKIPITFSPNSTWQPGRSWNPWPQSGEPSQAPCQSVKRRIFRSLDKKPRSNDRGTFAGRATFAGQPARQRRPGDVEKTVALSLYER